MENLLTINEAAAKLKVSRATVYAWIKGGTFPHVKLGGATRVRPEDLQAYVEARVVSTPAPALSLEEAAQNWRKTQKGQQKGAASVA